MSLYPSRYLQLTGILLLLAACSAPAPAPTPLPPTATAAPAASATPAPSATPAVTPTPTALPAVVVSPVNGMPQGTDGYPWWNDTVFYEVFVRSFYDSNGDGIGDLRGLIEKLDYLNDGDPSIQTDLGVTGIWLMPINPASSYHGYDVTDYYSINPQYGSLDDLKTLLTEAHKRGIRVIMDLVLNHTSSQHPWFLDAQKPGSKYHDWYVWAKDKANDSAWHLASNGEYYYGFFGANMPDLNYTNPAVTSQMEDVTRFWLKDVGVDGFRLDAIRYLIEQGGDNADTSATHDWLKQFRTFYKAINPQAVTVGEVWTNTFAVVKYVEGNELDLAFDFDLAGNVVTSANLGNAFQAAQTLSRDYNWFKPDQYATFLTNHDMVREMSLFRGQAGKAGVAAALLLASPGVPFIYYGEEIGMLGQKPDPEIRVPMQWTAGANGGFTTGSPWEAPNPDFNIRNVTAESADPGSLLSIYRELIRLRGEHAALRVGDFKPIDTGNNAVIAWLRTTAQEAVLVVINLGKDSISDYNLTLTKSNLAGVYRLAPLLGSGSYMDLKTDGQGGFSNFKPSPILSSYESLILQLQPGV